LVFLVERLVACGALKEIFNPMPLIAEFMWMTLYYVMWYIKSTEPCVEHSCCLTFDRPLQRCVKLLNKRRLLLLIMAFNRVRNIQSPILFFVKECFSFWDVSYL
jgi:hypothetical protein